MQRRLAAILAADMVGYSRLMSADEEGTHRRQSTLLEETLLPLFLSHQGRIVKTTGDGVLVEFSVVADAVTCAINLQQAVANIEQSRPIEQRIQYRIGINLGDIIIDNDDIFGDGVNIASRLEGLAKPGGICISDPVQSSIRNKLDVRFEDYGEQHLKNISEPIRVWHYRDESDIDQAEDSMAKPMSLELPQKPSLAVLPFTNMSGDVEQEHFADGMAEDIITELSRMPWFYVIARNSSFIYKGKAVDVKTVGRELGVAYVLEGSVRRAGNRLRITAQLIDAQTNNHVWANRYDREVTDLFDIQDEITTAITEAVAPEFISAEIQKANHKSPDQLDAWETVMKGRALLWKMNRNDNEQAKFLFERAIKRSPGQQLGLTDLSLLYCQQHFYNWSTENEKPFNLMVSTARRAVDANNGDPLAWTIFAWAMLFSKDWDEAAVAINRALKLSPNFAPAIGVRAGILACNDEPDLAISVVQNAIRRSPYDSFMPYWLLSTFWAYHSLQDYEGGLKQCSEGHRIAPKNPTFLRQLVVCHYMLGNQSECETAVKKYLSVEPNATASDSYKIPSRNKQQLERYVRILENAGVPFGQPED